MNGRSWTSALACALAVTAAVGAQTPAAIDGAILERSPFAITAPYDELDELTRFRFPRDVYDEARTQQDFVGERIVYRSGGLRIVGFVYRPKVAKAAPLPAILYARGGTSDFGAIDESDLVSFHGWAKAGFAVLATNYRGGGGSEGIDEWGGRDVDDLMNLVGVARELGGIDLDNLFLLGLSRGGPMVYIACHRGIAVRAAAVMGGVSDLRVPDMQRAEFIDGDDPVFHKIGWPGWRRIWPDYDTRRDEHLAARSAVCWAGELKTPLLVMHSRIDPRVPVSHAFAMAQALQSAGKEYELVIYGHDGHSLPLRREDRDQHIVNWFRSHMVTADARPTRR